MFFADYRVPSQSCSYFSDVVHEMVVRSGSTSGQSRQESEKEVFLQMVLFLLEREYG